MAFQRHLSQGHHKAQDHQGFIVLGQGIDVGRAQHLGVGFESDFLLFELEKVVADRSIEIKVENILVILLLIAGRQQANEVDDGCDALFLLHLVGLAHLHLFDPDR